MPINRKSTELKNELLKKLGAEKVRVNGEVYQIGEERVNIRCRTSAIDAIEGRRYWYSFNFDNIAKGVSRVIFMTLDTNYYIDMPVKFLEEHKREMYFNKKSPNTGVFYISWDELSLILKNRCLCIDKYYRSLVD